MLLKIEQVCIIICILVTIVSVTAYRVTKNQLNKAISDNNVLQTALKNPKIVEKPVYTERRIVVYKDREVSSNTPSNSKNGYSDEEYRKFMEIFEQETKGEVTREPFIPINPNPVEKKNELLFVVAKDQLGIEYNRQIYKTIVAGIEVNTKNIEVNIGKRF